MSTLVPITELAPVEAGPLTVALGASVLSAVAAGTASLPFTVVEFAAMGAAVLCNSIAPPHDARTCTVACAALFMSVTIALAADGQGSAVVSLARVSVAVYSVTSRVMAVGAAASMVVAVWKVLPVRLVTL